MCFLPLSKHRIYQDVKLKAEGSASARSLIIILINFAFLGAGIRAEMDDLYPKELDKLVLVDDQGAAPSQDTTEYMVCNLPGTTKKMTQAQNPADGITEGTTLIVNR